MANPVYAQVCNPTLKTLECCRFYDGELVPKTPCTMYKDKERVDQTHHASIRGEAWVVAGLKSCWPGRGGGSFANHCADGANAQFSQRRKYRVNMTQLHHRDAVVSVEALLVIATRAIKHGEEITVNYGTQTAARLSIPHDK